MSGGHLIAQHEPSPLHTQAGKTPTEHESSRNAESAARRDRVGGANALGKPSRRDPRGPSP